MVGRSILVLILFRGNFIQPISIHFVHILKNRIYVYYFVYWLQLSGKTTWKFYWWEESETAWIKIVANRRLCSCCWTHRQRGDCSSASLLILLVDPENTHTVSFWTLLCHILKIHEPYSLCKCCLNPLSIVVYLSLMNEVSVRSHKKIIQISCFWRTFSNYQPQQFVHTNIATAFLSNKYFRKCNP